MQKFEYPFFFKLLYRYGNIPVNLILIFYLYLSAIGLNNHMINVLPLMIIMTALYFLNKRYLFLYKVLPYKIEADEEKMICSDYLMSQKKMTIYFKDISELKGGVFEGRISGLMLIYDGNTKAAVGFFIKLKNAGQLQTLILSKVRRSLYDDIVGRISIKSTSKK